MDHRWDDMLRQERGREVEHGRYGARPIERDPDVERRDQLEAARRRVNKSPWEIGAAHWDQRDLYTANSHVTDDGYKRGPSYHPEEGSYAYPRAVLTPLHDRSPSASGEGPNLYEREAWPWLNYYDRVQPVGEGEGLWERLKHGVGRLAGRDHGPSGPKGWHRADTTIREEVCEALAYAQGLDARDIEVEVKDAEVWLKGTVRARDEKRRAEDLAELVRGVIDVHNRLRVRKDDDELALPAPVPAY